VAILCAPDRLDGAVQRGDSGSESHCLKLKPLPKVFKKDSADPVRGVSGSPSLELGVRVVFEDVVPEVDPAEFTVVMVPVRAGPMTKAATGRSLPGCISPGPGRARRHQQPSAKSSTTKVVGTIPDQSPSQLPDRHAGNRLFKLFPMRSPEQPGESGIEG
jgi:hypothetical protein